MTANHRIHPYAPLSIDVNQASIMVLPPLASSLTPANTAAWVTGHAYAQGAIVRNAKGYFWAPVAGTSGATAPVHADGDASDGSVTWRRIRYLREVLSITNLGNAAVFIARGYAAVANKGVVLYGSGSLNEGYENGLVRPYGGAYYAIAAGSSAVTLAISEG